MLKEFVTIKNNKAISTRTGETIVEGEIENVDNIESGMELIDGVWKLPVIPPITPQPTNQEVMDNQMIIMEVLATMYEEMLMKGTV